MSENGTNGLNGYNLMKGYFYYFAENPELMKPVNTALFYYIVFRCNEQGWKKKFGLPTKQTMNDIGVPNYKIYKRAFDALIEHGFIKLVQKSTNQYQANIIALVVRAKAVTKAGTKAVPKQCSSTDQGSVDIDKLLKLSKLSKPSKGGKARPSDISEVANYFESLDISSSVAKIEAEKFWNYYESVGWIVSKGKPMKKWKASAVGWKGRMKNFQSAAVTDFDPDNTPAYNPNGTKRMPWA